MALRELSPALTRIVRRDTRPIVSRVSSSFDCRRYASSETSTQEVSSEIASETNPATLVELTTTDFEDLESQSSFNTGAASEVVTAAWDPVKRAKARTRQLPASRLVNQPHLFPF